MSSFEMDIFDDPDPTETGVLESHPMSDDDLPSEEDDEDDVDDDDDLNTTDVAHVGFFLRFESSVATEFCVFLGFRRCEKTIGRHAAQHLRRQNSRRTFSRLSTKCSE